MRHVDTMHSRFMIQESFIVTHKLLDFFILITPDKQSEYLQYFSLARFIFFLDNMTTTFYTLSLLLNSYRCFHRKFYILFLKETIGFPSHHTFTLNFGINLHIFLFLSHVVPLSSI